MSLRISCFFAFAVEHCSLLASAESRTRVRFPSRGASALVSCGARGMDMGMAVPLCDTEQGGRVENTSREFFLYPPPPSSPPEIPPGKKAVPRYQDFLSTPPPPGHRVPWGPVAVCLQE